MALPLGELSPKVTERALQALPISSGRCSNGTHLRLVIARRAQARRGNLRKAATNLPGAFPCSGRYREIATAPAEPRNDKLGGLLHPEGRSDKLASAFLPCHCGARSALGSPFGRAVTEGD